VNGERHGMDKIVKDSVCCVCKEQARGYVVVDGRDEEVNKGRKLTLFFCSRHLRSWINGELDYLIRNVLFEGAINGYNLDKLEG
jgi:hypothetical protein